MRKIYPYCEKIKYVYGPEGDKGNVSMEVILARNVEIYQIII